MTKIKAAFFRKNISLYNNQKQTWLIPTFKKYGLYSLRWFFFFDLIWFLICISIKENHGSSPFVGRLPSTSVCWQENVIIFFFPLYNAHHSFFYRFWNFMEMKVICRFFFFVIIFLGGQNSSKRTRYVVSIRGKKKKLSLHFIYTGICQYIFWKIIYMGKNGCLTAMEESSKPMSFKFNIYHLRHR